MRKIVGVLLIAGWLAPLASAAPLRSPGRPETLTFGGPLEVRSEGQTVVVTLRAANLLFKVETAKPIYPPIAFRGRSSEILVWDGHLAVIAPRDGRAFHFSLPGYDGTQTDQGQSSEDIDALLRSQYQLIRIDTGTAIIARGGPGAFLLGRERSQEPSLAKEDWEVQDPGSGGLSTCGKSCSISCGDGSSCSATCTSPRCAQCTCPASCSCNSQ